MFMVRPSAFFTGSALFISRVGCLSLLAFAPAMKNAWRHENWNKIRQKNYLARLEDNPALVAPEHLLAARGSLSLPDNDG